MLLSLRSLFTITLVAYIAVTVVCSTYAREQPQVGWGFDFVNSNELDGAKITAQVGSEPETAGSEMQDVRIENGMLHLGIKGGLDYKERCNAMVAFSGMSGIEIKDFPVLEIRYRLPQEFDPEPSNQLVWEYKDYQGGSAAFWLGFPFDPVGNWIVKTFRIAPDSSVPGTFTPAKITSIKLRIGSQPSLQPVWYEIDYIRLRSFTAEEARTEQDRIDLLGSYTPPSIPKHVKNVFFYGAFAEPRRYPNDWEDLFDNMTRTHMNLNARVDAGEWHGEYLYRPGYLRDLAKEAWAYGIYFIAQPGRPIAPDLETEGRAYIEKNAELLAAEVKDSPNIVGWYVRDEPYKSDLWGVAGAKAILEQKAPQAIGMFPHYNLSVVQYYDRFSTTVWTDDYPLFTGETRNPWSVGKWCRDIAEASDKMHWFCAQAWGATDWWNQGKKRDYSQPTTEEFRLMMNLALANGVKAFTTWVFHGWHELVSMTDLVGNPTNIQKEAARLGAKWMAVGPLLLDAKPIFDPQIVVTTNIRREHGISVGPMGDPVNGPLFMVVVNEDISHRQSGKASLPDEWIGQNKAVYDLHSLKKVTTSGADTFDIRPLEPGDGRVYMLGTDTQFAAARREILKYHVEETLRVQGADRIIAERWGLDLSAYDATVRQVKGLIKSDKHDRAVKVCSGPAARALDQIMVKDRTLADSRSGLLAARKDLGKTILAVYSGYKIVRAGQELKDEPCTRLIDRYGDLRRRYLMGEKAGLLSQIIELRKDISKLR